MEEHLIKQIARGLRRTPASKRIAEVREFMGRSAAHRELIEMDFPELYREAASGSFIEHSPLPPSRACHGTRDVPVALKLLGCKDDEISRHLHDLHAFNAAVTHYLNRYTHSAKSVGSLRKAADLEKQVCAWFLPGVVPRPGG
jgi:hypothetical protein